MPTRKDFLRTTTIALAGIPFSTLWRCRPGTTDPPIACVTGEDILGPFYRAEAPFRTALNVLNELGTPILIRGQVLIRVQGAQHKELVTQLYFADDEFIAADPWASRADAGRIIPLVEAEGVLQGNFNLFLQPV